MTLELSLQRTVRQFKHRNLLSLDIVGARHTAFAPSALGWLAIDERTGAIIPGGNLSRYKRETVPWPGKGGDDGQHQRRTNTECNQQRAKIKPGVLEQGSLLKWCAQCISAIVAKTPFFAIMGTHGVKL